MPVEPKFDSFLYQGANNRQRESIGVHILGGGIDGGGGDASAANQVTLNARVGLNNDAAPASDTDPASLNGRLQRIAQRITDLIGRLPTGLGPKAAGESLSVAWASGQDPLLVSGPVTNAQLRASALEVSMAAAPLPAGAATDASVTALASRLPAALGAAAAANSLSVTLASNHAPVQVTGALTDGQLRATPLSVTGTFWQATQPVSLAALPALPAGSAVIGGVTQSGAWNIGNITGAISLPTGAATAAAQATGNTSLGNMDTAIGARADAAATTDGGTFSLISLFKRLLSGVSTMIGHLSTIATAATDGSAAIVVGSALTPTNVGDGAVGSVVESITLPAGTQAFDFYNLSANVIWASWTNPAPSAFGSGCFPIPPYSAATGAGYAAAPTGGSGTFAFVAPAGPSAFTATRWAYA